MKFLLAFALSLGSLTAFAGFTEVECMGTLNTAKINVEIEEGMTPYALKDARLSIRDGSDVSGYWNYIVSTRFIPGFNRVEFHAPELALEVDFWPDNGPRWGRSYRGVLRSTQVARPVQVRCRFPNVRN